MPLVDPPVDTRGRPFCARRRALATFTDGSSQFPGRKVVVEKSRRPGMSVAVLTVELVFDGADTLWSGRALMACDGRVAHGVDILNALRAFDSTADMMCLLYEAN